MLFYVVVHSLVYKLQVFVIEGDWGQVGYWIKQFRHVSILFLNYMYIKKNVDYLYVVHAVQYTVFRKII